MKNSHLIVIISVFGMLAACSKELPPRTVSEFRENSILLEATMVHCAQNRSLRKYEVECVNAREAINLIAREEAEASRERLEAQSERKRRALRRAQEAAAEARRRAAAAEKQRLEAEYLGQFDALPVDQESYPTGELVSPAEAQQAIAPAAGEGQPVQEEETAPVTGNDLDAIRKELERRQN